jgi:hypothetical protein
MTLDTSGVIRSDYDKIAIEAGLIMNQEQGRTVLVLRPSGATNDTLNGYRIEWEHNNGPADTLTFDRVDNGAITNLDTFNIDRTESLRILAEDDGQAMTIWANASGTWEFIHRELASKYNYLPQSGYFQLRTDDANLIHGVGDVTFYGDHADLTGPLPSSGFIEIARDTFKSASPGSYLRVDPLWSSYDENGTSEPLSQQYRFKYMGDLSGVVPYRLNPTTASPDRYNIAVFQSGFIRGNGVGEYSTVSVQADALLSAPTSNFHIYMRPSGVGHPSLHGYRFLWNTRTDYHGKDYFSLWRMVGGVGVSITGVHGDTKYEVAKSNNMRICGVDNGSALIFYALHPASGTWQEVFRHNTTTYNDHPYSGSVSSTSISAPTIDHAFNNLVIQGIPALGMNSASGQIGGYADGLINSTSGQIGGYADGLASASGQIGGYAGGLTSASGQIGCYARAPIDLSGPLPSSGFIDLYKDTFNDRTPDNYLTDEDLWSGYNEAGDPVSLTYQYKYKYVDDVNGVMPYRTDAPLAVANRYHMVVLQSGFVRGDGPGEYSAIQVQGDISVEQAGGNYDLSMFLRTSGIANVGGSLPVYGYRFARAVRNDKGGLDYFTLFKMTGTGAVHVNDVATGQPNYYIPKARYMPVACVDDGASLTFYAQHPASGGQWEQVFKIISTTYNDHPYSGVFGSAAFNSPLADHGLNNVIIRGIPNSPVSAASGVIGGYICGLGASSGQIGGYAGGSAGASGQVGGYANGVEIFTNSGQIGGYTSAAVVSTTSSGQVGGYVSALATASGTVGGYLSSSRPYEPKFFSYLDPSILSYWYFDETQVGHSIVDYGSYGTTLGVSQPVNNWILTSGILTTDVTPNIERAHARFQDASYMPNPPRCASTATGKYGGDVATNFSIFGWIQASGGGHGFGDPPLQVLARYSALGIQTTSWELGLIGASLGSPVTQLSGAITYGAGASDITSFVAPVDKVVPSGQPVLVGMTCNRSGSEYRLYIDGYVAASGALPPGGTPSGTFRIGIGGAAEGGLPAFRGALQDWIFANRVITGPEMLYVAESGVGGNAIEDGNIGAYLPGQRRLVTANEEQMQAVWQLNETDDEGTRFDISGKGNHLDVIIGDPIQITGRRGNATSFRHWGNPYPSLQRTGSGVSTGLSPTQASWTMGMWVNPSGTAYERYAQLVGKGAYDQYVMYIDEEGEVWGQVSIDGIGYVIASQPSSLLADEWQHLDWVVDRENQSHHIYLTGSDLIPRIIASGDLPSPAKLQDTADAPFHVGSSPTNQQPFDGSMDEIYFIQRALSKLEIISVIGLGIDVIVSTPSSGQIGGYLQPPISVTGASGQIGAYTTAVTAEDSGQIGGYVEQSGVATGTSGQIGGYLLYDVDSMSGQIGGYALYSVVVESGQVGGYLAAVGTSSGEFLSMFTYVTPVNLDFDIIARIGNAENSDFDGSLRVLRQYTPPIVDCYVSGSGTLGGFHHITVSGTVTIGDETIQNGATNEIESVWIQFGNMSGQIDITPSDGVFEVEHTYTSSGVYIVRVDAIDKQGTRGSCSKRVDLSVGLPAGEVITLDLSATPQSGVTPLTVAFTQAYGVQPIRVQESIINFGDRTLTHYGNPVHLYHSVGDYIPVWIVRDENGRFWCDSLVIGVNQ